MRAYRVLRTQMLTSQAAVILRPWDTRSPPSAEALLPAYLPTTKPGPCELQCGRTELSVPAPQLNLASRFHGGAVLEGGPDSERRSWPGIIRVVETRLHPLEGAPVRCPTLPCSSTLVRASTSLRSRRSRTPVRCC